MGRMLMWHPDLPQTIEAPVDVDERDFEVNWSKPQLPHREEGWRRWTSEEAARAGHEETPAPPQGPQAPPLTGAGSGREAWLAYAEELGVTLEQGTGKHRIIEAITNHQTDHETEE